MKRFVTAAWKELWEAIAAPGSDPALEAAIAEKAKASAPVVWMLGKVQSGKSSIIQALTGSTAAEVGNGFKACTASSAIFDFPADAPVARFLDTRGLGEIAYQPSADLALFKRQSHLLLVVMKALDPQQDLILDVVRSVRAHRPDWPIVVAQTTLHEAYPPGQGHLLPYPFDADGKPAATLPGELARSLAWQRSLFAGIPGSGQIAFVPLDFTKVEDGLQPRHYGLEALMETLANIAPSGLAASLGAHQEAANDQRARRAHPHIMGYAAAAAAADVVPLAGLVAVPAVQAKMLHSLTAIYGIVWDRRTFGEFAAALGAGAIVRTLSAFGLRQLAKLVPVYGQTAGAAAAAAMSFATTYALGKAAAYFLSRRRVGAPAGEGVLSTYQDALKTAFAVAREKHAGQAGERP